VDLQVIVERAAAALRSDWAADANYAYLERDETRKGGKTTSYSFESVTIDGSDYRLPAAVDDQPVSPERHKFELGKLRAEVERRKNESPAERARRIAKWKKQRDENGEMMLDFPTAFTFRLVGEETRDGHAAWVLDGTPKPGAPRTTLAQKVLAGMRGTASVEKANFHPIFVKCEVERPIPMYGNLASVLPGTQIEIGMTPVNDATWLIDLVSMQLDVSKLHLFKSAQATRTTYTQYRLNGPALEELLAEAGRQ
jgi:hypothetical protein